jgi:hypothetical protein
VRARLPPQHIRIYALSLCALASHPSTSASMPIPSACSHRITSASTLTRLCAQGFLTNILDLLYSPADAISELTGKQLVAKKVNRMVMMGGRTVFRKGTPVEWNLGGWWASLSAHVHRHLDSVDTPRRAYRHPGCILDVHRCAACAYL